jgi:crotonobetaine/carnitine-CoA ligase
MGRLEVIATVAGQAGPVAGLEVIDAERVHVNGEPDPPERPVEPWDTQAILYTSGTTGPSKGVLSSYMQAYAMFGPRTMPFMNGDDRFLINMPMFHVGGATLLYSMLIHGGSAAVVEAFSGERFWPQIRATGCTIVFLLGVMANFVERRPPSPNDADNPLEKVFMVPLLDDVQAFSHRFGVDVYTIYNMTELSAPIISDPNPTIKGTCGRLRPASRCGWSTTTIARSRSAMWASSSCEPMHRGR